MIATSATWAHVRLLSRSRFVILVNASAGLWMLGQVAIRARDASTPISVAGVAADLTDGLHIATAGAALVAAAYLLGAHSDPRADLILHLAGIRRGPNAASASLACLLVSIGGLGLAAAVGLAATPLFSSLATPISATPAPAHLLAELFELGLTLVVGTALWTTVGGAVGAIAGGRAAGTGAALLLFAGSQVVERIAVTYPALRNLWAFFPGGSVNVVLTGRSIRDMPQTTTTISIGVAGVSIWAIMLWTVAVRRAVRRGKGRASGTEFNRPAILPERGVLTASGALLMVAMASAGWLLPPAIARGTPWRYTYEWRHAEAMQVAPDDVTRAMLDGLLASGRLPEQYFGDDGYAQAQPYLADLKSAGTNGWVFNITSADRPGEVAIMANDHSGVQLMTCLRSIQGTWRIIGMRDNLRCEDFLDEW